MGLKLKAADGTNTYTTNFISNKISDYKNYITNVHDGITEYLPLSNTPVGYDSLSNFVFTKGTESLHSVNVKQVLYFDLICVNNVTYNSTSTNIYGETDDYNSSNQYAVKAANVTLRYNGGPYTIGISNVSESKTLIEYVKKTNDGISYGGYDPKIVYIYPFISITGWNLKAEYKYKVSISSAKKYDYNLAYNIDDNKMHASYHGSLPFPSYWSHSGTGFLSFYYNMTVTTNEYGSIKIKYFKLDQTINGTENVTSKHYLYWNTKDITSFNDWTSGLTFGCSFSGLNTGNLNIYIGNYTVGTLSANVHMDSRGESIGGWDIYASGDPGSGILANSGYVGSSYSDYSTYYNGTNVGTGYFSAYINSDTQSSPTKTSSLHNGVYYTVYIINNSTTAESLINSASSSKYRQVKLVFDQD